MPDSQTPSGALVYPHAEPPAPGAFIEVAPGIRWLRFPLPFQLNHINLWLLDDGDSWVLIDTGILSEASLALWNTHFATTFEGRPLTRLVCTHYHPDHIGCAGWLVDRWRPQFLTTRTEWLYATMLTGGAAADAVAFWGEYYRSAGIDEPTIQAIANLGENYAKHVAPIPSPFDRLIEGDSLTIGGREWRVIIGLGHAPEMICLYCAEDRLLISADQVLPGISPNIGVYAPEPNGDPLSEFLATCARLQSLHPDTLVLPSHGKVFTGLHARLDQLTSHHADRLRDTLAACHAPRTIKELLPVLFRRELDFQQTQFAVGEAFAHTNYLVERGELLRIAEPGQPLRFRTV